VQACPVPARKPEVGADPQVSVSVTGQPPGTAADVAGPCWNRSRPAAGRMVERESFGQANPEPTGFGEQGDGGARRLRAGCNRDKAAVPVQPGDPAGSTGPDTVSVG